MWKATVMTEIRVSSQWWAQAFWLLLTMAVLKMSFCGEVINDFSTVWGSLNSVLHVSSVRTCKHLVSGPEREQQHWFITVANNGGLCGGRLQPEGPTVGLQTRASLFSAAADRAAQRSASGQWLFLKGPHMQKEPAHTGDRESPSHPGAGGGLSWGSDLAGPTLSYWGQLFWEYLLS